MGLAATSLIVFFMTVNLVAQFKAALGIGAGQPDVDDPSLAERVRFDRIHDPECICCHTAGWDPQEVLRYESGYVNAEQSAHLKGVHCENCHGPAGRHVELEESIDATEADVAAEREQMHISAEWAKTELCIKCHDHENSPDFDFDTYWPQIEH